MKIIIDETSAKGSVLDRVSAFGNSLVAAEIETAESKMHLCNMLSEFHKSIERARFVFVLNEAGKSAVARPTVLSNWPYGLFQEAESCGLVTNLLAAGTGKQLGNNCISSCLEFSNTQQLINIEAGTTALAEALVAAKLDITYGFALSLGTKTESRLVGLIEGTAPDSAEEQAAAELFYRSVGARLLSIAAQQNMNFPVLSKRETECIRWTAEGKTSYEIGIILGLSENTINNYIASVTKKMGAVNRSHMISLAFRNGIIS